MKNLYELYCEKTSLWKDKKLFDNSITYSESFSLMKKRGAFLHSKGYRQGDVIAILAANGSDWCMTYMAITACGMIVLPLDTNLSTANYSEYMGLVGAKAVFVSDEYKDKVNTVPVFDIGMDTNVADENLFIPGDAEYKDIASYVFTSGTTGVPKIVMLTHENIITTPVINSDYILNSDDHFLSILPLFHVYAVMADFFGPYVSGATIVFLRSLKGPDIIGTLAKDQFTVFPAAPQLWELFFDAILSNVRKKSIIAYIIFKFFLAYHRVFRAVGLGFLPDKLFAPVRKIFGPKMRFFISGGAPLKKRYYEYYTAIGIPVVEGYGLTETSGPVTLSNGRHDLGKKFKAGSVGKTMKGNFLKIKNPTTDGIGEVWIKGSSVFAGYYKNEKANQEVFDDEGYFNTGDIGRLDKDGDLFLTGRKKNTIVLDSGKNVYPDEIEAHIKTSSRIADVAVFGRKLNGKETVVAVIVPAAKGINCFAEIKAIINDLNRALPPYKRVSRIALSYDPLPKNSTRKTLMEEVKNLFDRGVFQSEEASAPEYRLELTGKTAREEAAISLLKKRLKTERLYANQTIRDFNLDSLEMIEIISYFEDSLGISIDERRMMTIETFEELIAYISACPESDKGGIDDQILRGPLSKIPRSIYNPFVDIFIFIVLFFSKLLWKLNVKDAGRLNDENIIIAANHQSFIDIVWIYCFIPRRLRRNVYMTGKSSLWILKFIFWGAPIIFIERDGNVVPSLKVSADVLRTGKSLVIFPEGTRSMKGDMGNFKSGAAYLSKNLNKKIVPVTINGAYEVMPRGKMIPRFFGGAKASLVVGEPIEPSAYSTVDELTTAIRNGIEKNRK